jgi:hypothetical protein
MPPKLPLPRALHIPSTPPPRPAQSQSWLHPKPHLAAYSHESSSSHINDSHLHFKAPTAPRLPPRRQPIYNPGGFGLGAHHAPVATPNKGKGKEVDEDNVKGEMNGKDEDEACYVVSDKVT